MKIEKKQEKKEGPNTDFTQFNKRNHMFILK